MNNPYAAPNTDIEGAKLNLGKIIRIKRFTPVQLGKVMAVVSFAMSLIFVPFLLFAATFGKNGSGGIAAGMMIALPLIYAVMGFISGVIFSWAYNFIIKFTGGIEFEVE